MKDIQLIIWGAGARGKRFATLFGQSSVVAFIDSNPELSETEIDGIPVIGFDDYLNNHMSIPILISVLNPESIIAKLIDNNVFAYFDSRELISEQIVSVGVYVNDCWELIRNYKWEDSVSIYGTSLYSMMLNYEVIDSGCKNVEIIPEVYCDPRRVNALKNCFSDIVFSTIEKHEKVYYSLPSQIHKAELESQYQINAIDIYNTASFFEEFWNRDLIKYKDKYKNKRCFVVATGPSLRIDDLNKLEEKNVYSFSVNRIFKMFEKTSWRPNAYVVEDPTLIDEVVEDLRQIDVEDVFISDRSKKYWSQSDSGNRFHARVIPGIQGEVFFSSEVDKYTYVYATVVYSVLQIAMYMGFNEIYLLGTDCNYEKGSKSNYCFEDDKADTMNHNEPQMILSYVEAKKYAEKNNVKIYNATRGGMLEVFERVEFDEVMEKI